MDNHLQRITRQIGKSFIHPNDKMRVEEEIKRSIASGADMNIDFKIITAKKNMKIVHCLARILKNDEGIPVKFIGSLRDVTVRRFMDNDLKNKVKEIGKAS